MRDWPQASSNENPSRALPETQVPSSIPLRGVTDHQIMLEFSPGRRSGPGGRGPAHRGWSPPRRQLVHDSTKAIPACSRAQPTSFPQTNSVSCTNQMGGGGQADIAESHFHDLLLGKVTVKMRIYIEKFFFFHGASFFVPPFCSGQLLSSHLSPVDLLDPSVFLWLCHWVACKN